MDIKEFTKNYTLQFIEVPNTNTLYIFRLNLIKRDNNQINTDQTKEWFYPKKKLAEDIANPHQIGPFSSEDNLRYNAKRFLVEMLFWSMGITGFYPLDKSKDIDFLFN